MSNSSNWSEAVVVIFAFLVLVVIASAIPILAANQEKTKQEAIKAGLVQDNEGHWVRPELESFVDD